jgi:hypothetical protein
MRTLIQKIINWFKRQFRKREFNKRQTIYQEVTDKLTPLIEAKQKQKDELIQEIQENYIIDAGVHSGSKFIPNTGTKKEDIYKAVIEKYGFRLNNLDIILTTELKFKCI